MTPLASIRRMLIGLLGVLASCGLLAAASHANELSGTAPARGFVIHDAQETLRSFCSTDAGGRLWLELPGGVRYELLTSTGDPAIANPGDGGFHPFDAGEVRATLDATRFPLAAVGAEIFILPYPRRLGLESAAGNGLILLAPGVRALSAEHQHAEFLHELGHVVQYALMPDGDVQRWSAYRRVRGIGDPVVYAATSAHADRPHEIFAEDFRMLFGDPLATYSGSIENAKLALPAEVAGLEYFMLDLAQSAAPKLELAAYPNPARGGVRFSLAGGAPVPLDLFDAAGRRIATLEPGVAGDVVSWSWERNAADGRRVAPGVVFARVRGGGASARVALLP